MWLEEMNHLVKENVSSDCLKTNRLDEAYLGFTDALVEHIIILGMLQDFLKCVHVLKCRGVLFENPLAPLGGATRLRGFPRVCTFVLRLQWNHITALIFRIFKLCIL